MNVITEYIESLQYVNGVDVHGPTFECRATLKERNKEVLFVSIPRYEWESDTVVKARLWELLVPKIKEYYGIKDGVNFSVGLEEVKQGKSIKRQCWNGKGLQVRMQKPDSGSANTLPNLYMVYPADHTVYPSARVPWLPSNNDIFAEDWEVV